LYAAPCPCVCSPATSAAACTRTYSTARGITRPRYALVRGAGGHQSLEASCVRRRHAHREHHPSRIHPQSIAVVVRVLVPYTHRRSFLMRTSTPLHFRCSTQLSSAACLHLQFSP
jgi:hypothetical protein